MQGLSVQSCFFCPECFPGRGGGKILNVEYMQTLQSRIIVVSVCSDSDFAFSFSSPVPYRKMITDIEIEFAFI